MSETRPQRGFDSMRRWAEIAGQVRETRKTSEKVAIVAAYLDSLGDGDLATAVVFLSGRAFPVTDPRKTGLGWAAISSTVEEVAGVGVGALRAAYDRSSDLGTARCSELLSRGRATQPAAEGLAR